MKNLFRKILPGALVAGVAMLLAGCGYDEPDPADGYMGIFVEAPNGAAPGTYKDVVMPETGLHINVSHRAVVPTNGFAILEVASVNNPVEPGSRVLCFLARVNNGRSARDVEMISARARGKRFVLMTAELVNVPGVGVQMAYTPIGIHPIDGVISGGDVYFYANVPAENETEKEKKMLEIRQKVNSTLLHMKKKAEAEK